MVGVAEERRLPAVAPLGDVVGHARRHGPRQPCHGPTVDGSGVAVNFVSWPRNSRRRVGRGGQFRKLSPKLPKLA
jgi:hypothetical protein